MYSIMSDMKEGTQENLFLKASVLSMKLYGRSCAKHEKKKIKWLGRKFKKSM